MTFDNLGKSAEDAAAKFLEKKKYQILKRNFRTKLGEIDIVCVKEGVYVFVEVKSGKMNPAFLPQVHLDERKKRKLVTLAKQYLLSVHPMPEARIDLIEVVEKDGQLLIDHFENVIDDAG